MKDYIKENFPSTELLDFALEVEKITTAKVHLDFRDNSMWIFFYCFITIDVMSRSIRKLTDKRPRNLDVVRD